MNDQEKLNHFLYTQRKITNKNIEKEVVSIVKKTISYDNHRKSDYRKLGVTHIFLKRL